MSIKINEKYKPLYTSEDSLIIVTGGRGCFQENQCVLTINGEKKISDIVIGDVVLSYNEEKKINEFKKVINTFEYENEEIVTINLKNGSQIKVTKNHKFFHKDRWVSVKDLLYLYYGNMEKNKGI